MMVCGPLLILAIMILTVVVSGAKPEAGVEPGSEKATIPLWLFRLGGLGGMALMAAGFALCHVGRARLFAAASAARAGPKGETAAASIPSRAETVILGAARIDGGLHVSGPLADGLIVSWPLASLSIAHDALRLRLLRFDPFVFERDAVEVEVRGGMFGAGIHLRHRTRLRSAVFMPMGPEVVVRALGAAGYLA